MKCLECGRDYKMVSNHVRQSHGMTCREYKIKHNIPLESVLSDQELTERLVKIATDRKETKEGKEHLDKLVNCGVKYNVCRSLGFVKNPVSKRKEWPKCSQEKVNLSAGLAMKNKTLKKIPTVKEEWESGVQIRELSVSASVAKKWRDNGLLAKRKKVLSFERIEAMHQARRDKNINPKAVGSRQRAIMELLVISIDSVAKMLYGETPTKEQRIKASKNIFTLTRKGLLVRVSAGMYEKQCFQDVSKRKTNQINSNKNKQLQPPPV